MSSVFSKVILGEIPGYFVWSDSLVVAFLSIDPLSEGHILVVPREEVDHWTDASQDLWSHLTSVARRIGAVQWELWKSERVGMLIQGLEVSHLHIHIWPVNSSADFDFGSTIKPDENYFVDTAKRLRSALVDAGYGEYVPVV